MSKEYYLGIDLGSVGVDGVVLDESEKVLWHSYQKIQGRSRDALASLFQKLLKEWIVLQNVQAFSGRIRDE